MSPASHLADFLAGLFRAARVRGHFRWRATHTACFQGYFLGALQLHRWRRHARWRTLRPSGVLRIFAASSPRGSTLASLDAVVTTCAFDLSCPYVGAPCRA